MIDERYHINDFNMINYDNKYGQYTIEKKLDAASSFYEVTSSQLHSCYRINKGNGDISDYKLFTNKKIDECNLDLLNHGFKGKGLFAVMDNKLWSDIERCVLYACYGQLSIEDFKNILGYDTADKGHLDVIAAKICGNVNFEDDVYKMECEINSIMHDIESSRTMILYGIGTYYDYSIIDTMSLPYQKYKYKNGYSNKYLALNGAIKGKKFETLEQLQKYIKRILLLYSKLQSLTSTVTKEELEELGIKNINEYNFEYILKELKQYSASSTMNSIYNGILKPIIVEIENNFEDMNNGTESCKGYQYAFGDKFVDSNNYKILNSAFNGRNVRNIDQAYNIAEYICDLYLNIISGTPISKCDLYNLGFKDLSDEIFSYVKEYLKSVLKSNDYKVTGNNLYTAIKRCIDSIEDSKIDHEFSLDNNDIVNQNENYEIVYVNDIIYYVNNKLYA